MLADESDQRLSGPRQAAIAAVDQAELTPEIDALDAEELHFAGLDLVARKTFTDEGNTDIGADEALDHPDAGELHRHVHARTVGAEQFIEDLPRIARARKNERLRRDLGERDTRTACKRIARADHEAKTIFVNVVDF